MYAQYVACLQWGQRRRRSKCDCADEKGECVPEKWEERGKITGTLRDDRR